MTGPELHYEQVHKYRFHRNRQGLVTTTEVLRDLDITFGASSPGQKEFTAIVGPSGSGKTTLFRLACRLEEPNCGIISLHGKDIRTFDPRDLRRRIGLVFQRQVLFDESVEDNVTYGLRVRNVSREEARELAKPVLEQLGLDRSFLDRKNTTLNSSQVARVVVARTLILKPEILLLDEPTARLDPGTASDMFEALNEIQDQTGTLVIFSTSRLAEARQFARRIVVVLDGAVVTDLPTEEFLTDSVPVKARHFLGPGGY